MVFLCGKINYFKNTAEKNYNPVCKCSDFQLANAKRKFLQQTGILTEDHRQNRQTFIDLQITKKLKEYV